jgi:glycosyltransferase involved in cell wall biosynthesis
MPSCSLIISTFNRPDALELCLKSVMNQYVLPQEVIIADDGSGDETKRVVEQFTAQARFAVKHVWQKDDGYQLSKIRNKAFVAATGDYILQTDGDLIFHSNFVKDHLQFAKKGCFVSGTRTNIKDAKTSQLLKTSSISNLTFYSAGIEKRYNAARVGLLQKLNAQLQTSAHNLHYVLGCNMAFWKEDLIKVNGYNEAFTGWGKEDNDLSARLINAGVKLRFLKFGAIVFHLWHREAARDFVSANDFLFQQSLKNNVTFVDEGMNQYINNTYDRK